jgi:hypothetical protein
MNNVYIASKTNENLPGNATHLEFDVSTDDIASLDLPNEIHGLVYCLGCECLRFRPAPTLLPFCSLSMSKTVLSCRETTPPNRSTSCQQTPRPSVFKSWTRRPSLSRHFGVLLRDFQGLEITPPPGAPVWIRKGLKI